MFGKVSGYMTPEGRNWDERRTQFSCLVDRESDRTYSHRWGRWNRLSQ